ncbi:alpha/beta hydrolase family protein [Actinomadura atramentaria]|uniref:alpha/beta hydrolase family protein n=1 Tax=Actinomadura atramentaria TaxID=1990 RepID=UPI0003664A52|nr:alpha/beta hydrolase [Actinomadura atramentaria]
MRRLIPFAAALAAAAVLVPSPARADSAATAPWDGPGPHRVATKHDGSTSFYYPADLAKGTAKAPVIIWGNGTFGSPAAYDGLLRHWAQYGFIVAAADTAFSNTGLEMRSGLDRLAELDRTAGSPFQGRVDLAHVAAAGHSQGGAGAINATLDKRVTTTVPVQPGPLASASFLHGPTLYLAGEKDSIVPPWLVRNFYSGSEAVPAVYAEVAGAGHLSSIGDGGNFRAVTTAWFRFQLAGDERARTVFFGRKCGICADPAFSDVERNARALAVPGAS